MERKRMVRLFEAAREAGPYDEFPVLLPGIDPQLHLSRNARPQPFFLICEQDTVLVQMSGEATVEFKDAPVLYHTAEPGDFVYVPGGTPHRIVPTTESIHVRYKAARPGLEGVAWYCPACGAELWREEWHVADELPQAAYWRACQQFNAAPDLRRCAQCGAEHAPVDLTGIRWPEIAAALSQPS
jgi:3-hydroxyanthranilate 3,4-dioxygenase